MPTQTIFLGRATVCAMCWWTALHQCQLTEMFIVHFDTGWLLSYLWSPWSPLTCDRSKTIPPPDWQLYLTHDREFGQTEQIILEDKNPFPPSRQVWFKHLTSPWQWLKRLDTRSHTEQVLNILVQADSYWPIFGFVTGQKLVLGDGAPALYGRQEVM